eukprot:m.610233 g.610233  ORF g.610233 m.610233 type:complete len:240 (-) comp22494_c0_seq10:4189-4908(-)
MNTTEHHIFLHSHHFEIRHSRHTAQYVNVRKYGTAWKSICSVKSMGSASSVTTQSVSQGHSAGAHLLAMHLLKSRAVDAGETAMEQRSDGIRGSILRDADGMLHSPCPPAHSGHRMGISLFRKIVFMFPVFGFDEDTWEGHFPLALTGDSEHVKQLDLPPFLFINAEYDVDLHDHTEDMVQRLARADVRAETFTVRGTTHFSVLLGLDRKFSLAESFTLPTAMDFIARVSKIQPRRIDA